MSLGRGGRLQGWCCAALALALCAPAAAQPSPRRLRLDHDPALVCPEEDVLRRALERRLGAGALLADDAPEDPEALRVQVLAAGEALLTLALASSDGEVIQERVLVAGEKNCPELPQTIALLVDAWLRELPIDADGFLSFPSVRKPAGPPPPPPAPQAPPAPPAPSPEPAKPLAPGRELHLAGAVLLGGSMAAQGGQGAFSGAIRIESELVPRLAIGFEAGAQTPISADAGGGTLSAALAGAQLYAATPVYRRFGGVARLIGGVGVQQLSATSEGFDRNRWLVVHDARFSAAAEWRQPVTARLHALAALRIDAALRGQRFTIANVSQDLTVEPARFGAFAGAGWDFF